MAEREKDTGRQIYPPTVTESLMQRIRTLTAKEKAPEAAEPAPPEPPKAPSEAEKAPKAPSAPEKPPKVKEEPADWKAAVGYGPLMLRVGKTDGKADFPRIGTLKNAVRSTVQSAIQAAGDAGRREKPAPLGEIGSFDCWFAAGGAVCQYSLRRVGPRAEGHARRTAPDGPSYDKPFTADAAALDGLLRLIGELKLAERTDEPEAADSPSAGEGSLHAREGTHLAVWYTSGESLRCHDSRKNRLTPVQRAAIRGWFEAVAGV